MSYSVICKQFVRLKLLIKHPVSKNNLKYSFFKEKGRTLITLESNKSWNTAFNTGPIYMMTCIVPLTCPAYSFASSAKCTSITLCIVKESTQRCCSSKQI